MRKKTIEITRMKLNNQSTLWAVVDPRTGIQKSGRVDAAAGPAARMAGTMPPRKPYTMPQKTRFTKVPPMWPGGAGADRRPAG